MPYVDAGRISLFFEDAGAGAFRHRGATRGTGLAG
jgi:hypothetical protein